MLPLQLVETDRDDFEGPVVELWRGGTFIGMVFWDGEAPILQVYPDGDDVHDLDVAELQSILDTALRIVDQEGFDEEMEQLREAAAAQTPGGDDHPATIELLGEFDSQAVFRTDDGEGFFRRSIAEAFIAKCEELDLAVVEMEGFDLNGEELKALGDLVLETPTQPMMTSSQFRTFANVTAQDTLRLWPSRENLVIAFVFVQPDGESIVA
ncbi:MAG: hypothetical protein ACR2N7_05165 [Acidimicrobiia bacterium]